MEKHKINASGIILFIFLLSIALFFMQMFHQENSSIKSIPQINYLIVVVALFFLNTIIFIFMILKYLANNQHFSTLILSLAFLSSLVYFVETIFAIHEPINGSALIHIKANDISIFYLFRHLSFIFLLSLALYSADINSATKNGNKKKFAVLLISLFPLFFLPIFSHNLSSYNPDYCWFFIDYSDKNESFTWRNNFIEIIICLWAFLLFFIITQTRLTSDIWPCIALLCLSAICCNLLLLAMDDYNYSVWYISRGIEVVSKLLIISVLIYNIFKELQLSNKLAVHDALTNIYNRRYFFSELESRLNTRDKVCFSIMFLDIDHFKRINDRWGHAEGDKVITTIADIVQKSIRSEDLLARLGGEEFGVMMYNTDMIQTRIIAERIRKNVEILTGAGNIYDIPEPITVSIGVFFATTPDYSASDLMVQADKALYEAKNNGRNQVVIHHA
ncbi:GGDEF domain-containing protein [Citrobacter sp. Awk 4]|uniref:sensor domain-containing diguanylate cyclase n=1 Tax=Citrobacter sp. Awk 4 TaxID=2963955 RepID=UPI0023029D27|nr:GGDEF domain-containing protein [Citrobacter sp. Awk 4]MDA8478938.1 GGDEF domain-containing protein [Citrobacter sp. Awk 4]